MHGANMKIIKVIYTLSWSAPGKMLNNVISSAIDICSAVVRQQPSGSSTWTIFKIAKWEEGNITGKRRENGTDKLKLYMRKRDGDKGTTYDSASGSRLAEL